MVSPLLPQVIYFFTISSLFVFRRVRSFQPFLAVLPGVGRCTPRQHHQLLSLSMVRGVKKEHLPEKVCVVCNRPFTWRKKWESCWDEVTTCSRSCNRKRRASQQAANRAARVEDSSDGGLEQPVEPRVVKRNPMLDAMYDEEDKDDEDDHIASQISEHDIDADRDSARLLLEVGSIDSLLSDTSVVGDEDDAKMARKLAKKQMKELRRLKRQGLAPDHGRKPCDVCSKSSDLLIRCTIDATEQWKMVCGSCWKSVSGGVVDGDANHPHYRYGGLWKNRARRS